ncbi:GIN domain-containing protein [Prevotella jejuni]
MKTTFAKIINIGLISVACLLALNSCYIRKIDYGKMVTEEASVDSFDTIDIRGAGTVYISQGKKYSLKFKGEEKRLDVLSFVNPQNRLVIDMKNLIQHIGFFDLKPSDRVTQSIDIYITTPTLSKLSWNNSATVILSDSFKLDKLSIEAPAGGNLKINKMNVNQLKVSMKNAGAIGVKSLTAKKADFDTNGDIGLGVNFYRTDTAIISTMGKGKANITGTTCLPLKMIARESSVINDKTTRIK